MILTYQILFFNDIRNICNITQDKQYRKLCGFSAAKPAKIICRKAHEKREKLSILYYSQNIAIYIVKSNQVKMIIF